MGKHTSFNVMTVGDDKNRFYGVGGSDEKRIRFRNFNKKKSDLEKLKQTSKTENSASPILNLGKKLVHFQPGT